MTTKTKKAVRQPAGTKRGTAAGQQAEPSPARVNLFDEPHENAVSLETLDFKEQILERFHPKMDAVLAILIERLPVSRPVQNRVLDVVRGKVIDAFVGDHFANVRLRESGFRLSHGLLVNSVRQAL